jgi:hypothetical protein
MTRWLRATCRMLALSPALTMGGWSSLSDSSLYHAALREGNVKPLSHRVIEVET